jgi:hypothetical protein
MSWMHSSDAISRTRAHNQTLETNRRPASPLDAGRAFGSAVHAPPCVSGGGRSAWRSIRMTDHAPGWFDGVREACCGDITEESTTAASIGRHGPEAPRISRIATDVRGRFPRPSSAPIRAICGHNSSGSNQALEPTETRGADCGMAALISLIASGLRGSVDRWADIGVCHARSTL